MLAIKAQAVRLARAANTAGQAINPILLSTDVAECEVCGKVLDKSQAIKQGKYWFCGYEHYSVWLEE